MDGNYRDEIRKRTIRTASQAGKHHGEGPSDGAQRNARIAAMVADRKAASKAAKEQKIAQRTAAAEKRKKETLAMAKEENLDEVRLMKPTKMFKRTELNAALAKHNEDMKKLRAEISAAKKAKAKAAKPMAEEETIEEGEHRVKWSYTRGAPQAGMPKSGYLDKKFDSKEAAEKHAKKMGMGSHSLTYSYANVKEETGTEARMKIKNVARPGDPSPTSEKSILAKQGEIKVKKVDEEIAESLSKKYGLSESLIAAARAIVEKKTRVDMEPETDDKIDDSVDDDTKSESKTHTKPKTDKEKKLAALAEPKDKITHKDVLVGRGVVRKEELSSKEKMKRGLYNKEETEIAEASVELTPTEFHSVRTGKKSMEDLAKAKGASVAKVRGEYNTHSDHWSRGEAHYNKLFKEETLDEAHNIAHFVSKVGNNTYHFRVSDKGYSLSNQHGISEHPSAVIDTKFQGYHKAEEHAHDVMNAFKHGGKDAALKHLNSVTYGHKKFKHAGVNEEVEQIDEVLTKKASAGDWIRDFQKSKNPKFAGKSQEKRREMALGAYYAKQNEEVDVELSYDEVERLEAIAAQLDEQKPTMTSAPIRGANQDQSGFGVKRDTADYTISDSKKMKMNEEVELDEVSASTKSSYIRSASRDATLANVAKRHAGSESERSAWAKREAKRKTGLSMAMKEEVDLEEASPMIAPPTNKYDSADQAKAAAKKAREAGKTVKVLKHTFTNPRTGQQSHTYSVKEEVELEESLEDWAAKHEKEGHKITKDNKTATYHAWDKNNNRVASYKAGQKMKEEVELEEGRGRPKKSGEAPEGDDTSKHPVQQLHKIATSIQGSEPHFEHKDGSKTRVSKQLAKHITAVYGSMRTTQEKDDFANKLHASRDSMMAAVNKHVR